MTQPIVCWWSGGVTSAVACKLAVDLYGIERCSFVFIDTGNEDADTMRFKVDCEKWYDKEIVSRSRIGGDYADIQAVWRRFGALNNATGAICSSELKRTVRERFERGNEYEYQVFGFDIDEPRRARNMKLNYPGSKPIFPLLLHGLSKKDCIKIIEDAGIEIPRAYKLGLNNNNCLGTGCVQGGIGYWQKMKEIFPEKFNAMAAMEHELTDKKEQPVTMLKDQGKGGGLVFLLPHPQYPDVKDISMMRGRPSKPLTDCNGFCGTHDGIKNETENEINFVVK